MISANQIISIEDLRLVRIFSIQSAPIKIAMFQISVQKAHKPPKFPVQFCKKMSSSPTTSESKPSPTASSRGSGFSMKNMILALVFGLFASPASAGMMMPGMMGPGMMAPMPGMPGMDPYMGGMGMPPMGMHGDPALMHAMGYRYKRGRRRLFGLLGRRRGHWRRRRYGYGYGMPGMGMGGMGMPGMPMGGMGMPGMPMGDMGMGMSGMGMPGGMDMMGPGMMGPGMGPMDMHPQMGMPGMGPMGF